MVVSRCDNEWTGFRYTCNSCTGAPCNFLDEKHDNYVMGLRTILLCLIVAAALVIGFMLYRSRSVSHLNITPDAEREIDKAKRR